MRWEKLTAISLFFLLGSGLVGQTSVLTQHNDVGRTGQNLGETILTPAVVSSGNFGQAFSLPVDGVVLAQPLYVPGLSIGGASHNVVFIATEHDSIFAFDADTGGAPLWQASLADAAHGAYTGATSTPDSQSSCPTQNHEYGITGTPVIDPVKGLLYVVSNTLEKNYPVYRLHALSLTTGAEALGGPVVISGSVAGTGVASSNGTLTFDPGLVNQRAGLGLVNGKVYITFGSLCDFGPYHGWLFEFDAGTLANTSVFVPTPNGIGSGLWMSGAAPSFDIENGVNRMFLPTGNGTYDATVPYGTNTMDYGDDVLQLNLSSGIQVADAFTPFNQATLQALDGDVASSGTLILPDQPGKYPHLLLQPGKGGSLYLLNRDNLGGYDTTKNNVVQEVDGLAAAFYGLPAYFNGNIYLCPPSLPVQQLSLTNGVMSSQPVAVSTYGPQGGFGSVPSISANGNTAGILWWVDTSRSTQVLYADDATNVANMLWNSGINPTRDSAGTRVGFVVPTIANGRVYVGSVGQVSVYGIINVPQTITFSSIPSQTSASTVALSATASSGLTVAFSSLTPTICSVTGSVANLLGQGTCTISASQAGNTVYTAATAVTQSFAVIAPAVPPNIGYLAYWGASDTGIYISWSTDVLSSTIVAFGKTTALGSFTPVQATLTYGHGVALTGLTPGTTYYFMAESTGANGATGYSTLYSFTTTGTAPPSAPVISSVLVSGITSASATVTWTTDQASSSQVSFGTTTSYGTVSTLDSNLVTRHSVTLIGLALGATYDFQVTSSNSGGASSKSANYTFTTSSTAGTPIISNVVSTISGTSAVITWSTDQATSSLVHYGTSSAYGLSSTLDPTLVTAHSVVLSGLATGTTYNFDVVSANSAGLAVTSPNATFATAAPGPAPVIGYLAFWGVSDTGVYISWSTDVAATTQLAYGTSTALGQVTPLQTALANSHGIVMTSLNPGTKYYFVAQSTSQAGVTGYSTVYSFTTTGQAPASSAPVISNVSVASVSGTSATITWVTDQASSSQINYGATTSYGSSTTLDTALVTTHSETVIGLVPGSVYNFDVVSSNASGTPGTSANYTFTATASIPTAPVITNVAPGTPTSSSVTITWTTDQPSSSQVNFGLTTAYGSASPLNSSLVTNHSVTLTGLAANTTYDFVVTSVGASALNSTSSNFSFTTAAAPSGPAPYVGYVAYWGVNDSGVTISWSTDLLSDTEISYGTSATNLPAPVVQSSTLGVNHGVLLSGLSSGTTYYFRAQSVTAAGVAGTSIVYSFTTTGTPGAAANITAVTASAISNTSAVVTWTTDQPSSSQVNYGTTSAYGTSTTLDTTLVTSHSVTLSNLASGTVYHLDVVSTTSKGVSSTSSPDYSFTTTGTVAAGPVVTKVVATSVTSVSATITWTTDQASSSQVNFGTTTAYGTSTAFDPTLVTIHSVVLNGLSAATTYNFDVASGTTTSGNFSFTTAAASTAPPAVLNLAYWGITQTGITISWSTEVAATTAVAYGTTAALGSTTTRQTALILSHGVVLTGLAPGTTYYFQAQSADGNGATGYSTTYSFTTLAGPPTISGITAQPMPDNTASVSWTTSVPTFSYVQYGTSSGNYNYYTAQTSLIKTPACTLTYVPSATIYYQVVSSDAYGNQTVSAEMMFTEP